MFLFAKDLGYLPLTPQHTQFIFIGNHLLAKDRTLLGLWLLCDVVFKCWSLTNYLPEKRQSQIFFFWYSSSSLLNPEKWHRDSHCSCPVGNRRFFQFETNFKSAFCAGLSWCSVMDATGSDTVLDQRQELHKTLGYGCLFPSSSRLLLFRTLCHLHTISLTKSALRPLDTRAEQRGGEREAQTRGK